MAVSKPVFVDVNPLNIVAEMITYYEAQLGKKLQPSDVETLIINGFAYREAILRNAINDAAVLNLLQFSVAPVLDYLGELVGVERIAAIAAECTVTLTFDGNVTDIVIPEGTRIAPVDQKVFFRLKEAVNVPAGTVNIAVKAACDTDGEDGNGYAIGQITVIMDPVPYWVGVTNSDLTAGGSAEENDERLRARIKLAPSSFSNAGPVGAYKFFALTASALIIDVAVPKVPLIPGQVNIYPLMNDGEPTPTEILDAVEAACNAESVRPICDTVVVTSPTRIEYSLTIHLTLFEDAITDDVLTHATENINAFVAEKRKTLGRDIKLTQLITAISEDLREDIYDIAIPGFSDISVDENSFAFCTGITIDVTGTNPG